MTKRLNIFVCIVVHFYMTIQVSDAWRQVQVEVMEPVYGLSIEGIPAAIPVGERRVFMASILTGKPVSFLWTFDLHSKMVSCVGKQVWALTR